jgi:spore germination protein KA
VLRTLKKIFGFKKDDNYKVKENKNQSIINKTNETFFSNDLAQNKNLLKELFYNSSDFVLHEFITDQGKVILLIYIDGLINKDLLDRDIIKALTISNTKNIKNAIHSSVINETSLVPDFSDEILSGSVGILTSGDSRAFLIDMKGFEKRSVDIPEAEAVIRGPKEGFVENLRTNTSLLRRKIKDINLVFEALKLGKRTKTGVAIAYIEDIVNKDVLLEVRRRLELIDTDAILETGYIEHFIEDAPLSILSTIGNTQKPDVVAAKLLEGRVAIFCDGTPHVLTVPFLFIENLQTAEDYYLRHFAGTSLRLIRFLAVFISTLLPSLYVAFQTFHQEMIPTVLLITMAASREGIPLPALAEAIIMTTLFEMLRESGTRLPRAVGSAISIVGALILGEAAVSAGLVSAPMVIVVAITAVASFITPSLTEAMSIYRFFFLFLGGTMGLYGISCGLIVVVIHALSLHSFGIPYTSPLSPLGTGIIEDYAVRLPLWLMKLRPQAIAKKNSIRQRNTRRNP